MSIKDISCIIEIDERPIIWRTKSALTIKNLKTKNVITFPISFFFSLTLCFFSSMDVFMANYLEFMLPIKHVWWIMLCFSVGIAVIVALLVSLLNEKLFEMVNVLIFAFGICFYVQSMFLNGNVQSFTGEIVDYSGKIVVVNIIEWFAILIAISAFAKVLGKKSQKVIAFISVAMILIQASGTVTSAFGLPRENGSKDAYLSSDGEFSLSAGKNVVVFIVDTCDGNIVDDALKKYPDLFNAFDGFTYYPDMVSTFSRTFPSVPYLLTGEFCYFDKPFTEYIHDAWENETFVKDLKANNTDVRIYTEPDFLDPTAIGYVDNYYAFSGNDLSLIHPFKLFSQMMHLAGYRVMPYFAKEFFNYTAQSVSTLSMDLPLDYAVFENDTDFLAVLLRKGISLDKSYESAFRFYHLWGTHPGHFLTADLTTDQSASDEEALYGCLKIISLYINQMKESKVFNDSTIIITADHGYSKNNSQLELDEARCCLLMVKEAYAEDIPLIVSDSPKSHEEFEASVLNAFGIDYAHYGTPFSHFTGTDIKTRHYYHSVLYSDIDGEIALREYQINGDARDFNNWALTGKFWDINYSQRDVSHTRLEDVME